MVRFSKNPDTSDSTNQIRSKVAQCSGLSKPPNFYKPQVREGRAPPSHVIKEELQPPGPRRSRAAAPAVFLQGQRVSTAVRDHLSCNTWQDYLSNILPGLLSRFATPKAHLSKVYLAASICNQEALQFPVPGTEREASQIRSL